MNHINQLSTHALPSVFLTLGFTVIFTLTGLTLTLCWPIDAVPSSASATPVAETSAYPTAELSVVITGAIQSPGVYQVSSQARIGDVVALAGGFTSEAMLLPRAFSNQGVYAGQILHIPMATETRRQVRQQNPDQGVTVQTVSGTRSQLKKRSSHQTPLTKAPLHKTDLNRASLKELMKLPGVGPALAKRIVKAREEKLFATPKDIVVRVKGIGPAKYKKMAAWVK